MKYESTEAVTFGPDELSKVVKFVGEDGTEREWIVSIPAARDVVSVITHDAALSAPVIDGQGYARTNPELPPNCDWGTVVIRYIAKGTKMERD